MRKTGNKILFLLIMTMGLLWGREMTQAEFVQTKTACENNDGAACAKLYYYYISSKRSYLAKLQEDKQKALFYAKKACELDDRDGCFTSGMTLYYGDVHANIMPDKEEGRRSLKKACELGMDDVCSFFLNKNF